MPLDWEDREGSACAYAPERRMILINRDWLEDALAEQVVAVLTEQLGHHLDVLFNSVDTPGGEGARFLECLGAGESSKTLFALGCEEDLTATYISMGRPSRSRRLG